MVRINRQRIGVGVNGGSQVSLSSLRNATIKPSPDVEWIVADGLIKIEFGLAWLIGGKIGEPTIEVGQHVVAIATDG